MIGVALPNGPFLLIESMYGVFTYMDGCFFNGEFACEYTNHMDAIGKKTIVRNYLSSQILISRWDHPNL